MANIEEMTAAIRELSQAVLKNSGHSDAASVLMLAAAKVAGEGKEMSVDTAAAMVKITDAARNIVSIVGLVEEISFQTTLLALNAAVEAARAGDAGRGFAVVAQEVKSLAGRTARATDDITAKITAIQHATRQTVEANGSIRETVAEVQSSADRIRQAMEIHAETVLIITAAVDETALTADSMSCTIAAIRSDTETVAREIDEVGQKFRQVDDQMSAFKDTTGQFVNSIAA